MISRKKKAIYMAAGGATAGALVWLGYARSAAGARSFLSNTGKRAGKSLNDVQKALSKLRVRIEEIDRLAHELAEVGSSQKERVETVLGDTLDRLSQTTETIQKNLTQSSEEFTALISDMRAAVKEAVSDKPVQAA